MRSDSQSKAINFIEKSAELTGAAIGGAIGFIAAGPIGAAGAGVLGVVITNTISQVADKIMSHRERIRVGTVAAIAASHIQERLEAGDTARVDFFLSIDGEQEIGAQLFEGILLKARDEYEEKKVQYLGRFFANLVFESEVSRTVASLLIKTLDRLTYRQLILLSLISNKGIIDMQNLRGQSHPSPELEAIKREEMDLHDNNFGAMGLVHGIGSYEDRLSPLGAILVKLAELNRIPEEETTEILQLLESCPTTNGLQSGYSL